MGTCYAIWNNAKKEYVFPGKVGQKYFEMFGYSRFITWLIFERWSGSPIEFRSEYFSEESYGSDFWKGVDKSEEYYRQFKDFCLENECYLGFEQKESGE